MIMLPAKCWVPYTDSDNVWSIIYSVLCSIIFSTAASSLSPRSLSHNTMLQPSPAISQGTSFPSAGPLSP